MNNLFVRNNGHFNDEIDFAGSEGLVMSSRCTFFLFVQQYSRRVCGLGGRIEGQSLRVSVGTRRCGQGLRFRRPWFWCSCVLCPSGVLQRCPGIMSEIDIFVFPTCNFQHLHSGPLAEEHCDRWIHQAICNQPRLGWLRGLCAPMSCCQAARHVPREFRACAADPLCTELCTRRSLLPRTPLTS